MTQVHFRRLLSIVVLFPICASVLSCDESIPVEVLTVSLSNTETFKHPTVGGDEDGAIITTQPQHAEISEIRRGAETNWVATYVYQPVPGYIGADYVQLEILTNSDGVGPPHVRRMTIHFSIHE